MIQQLVYFCDRNKTLAKINFIYAAESNRGNLLFAALPIIFTGGFFMGKEKTQKKSMMDSFLTGIEAVCNKLPSPAFIFIFLFAFVAVISAIVSMSGVSVPNPASGETVSAQNFFSVDGLHWFLNNMVSNFTGFAPLGLVLTMTLGIGLCEESGLVMSLLKGSLSDIPPAIVPFVIAFIGTVGNIASDTANVIVPPIAGILFLAAGRHPIAGMICGYAGTNAGFTANIMVAGTDSLLQGITNTAILSLVPDGSFEVDVTCNWFFMIASTFFVTLVIGFVTNKIIEPRFGKYTGAANEKLDKLEANESKGLRVTGIAVLIYIIAIVALFFTGPLAGENGAFVGSPLLKGLIPIMFLFFILAAVTYGTVSGSFKNTNDISKAMNKQMSGMGSFVCFAFFAGQFQALFNWTNLGTMLSVLGANGLESIGLVGVPMFILFILLVTVINLFMSSGSAKWAILAPIFVPMFMLLGYHPAWTQLLYRLGDSPTNAITPVSPYIWMVLELAKTKYDPDLKLGTLVSGLLPIAVILEVLWIIFLVVWFYLGLPIGPGVGAYLPAGIL